MFKKPQNINIIDKFTQMDEILTQIYQQEARQVELQEQNQQILTTIINQLGAISGQDIDIEAMSQVSELFNENSYTSIPLIFHNREDNRYYISWHVRWLGDVYTALVNSPYGSYEDVVEKIKVSSFLNTILDTSLEGKMERYKYVHLASIQAKCAPALGAGNQTFYVYNNNVAIAKVLMLETDPPKLEFNEYQYYLKPNDQLEFKISYTSIGDIIEYEIKFILYEELSHEKAKMYLTRTF